MFIGKTKSTLLDVLYHFPLWKTVVWGLVSCCFRFPWVFPLMKKTGNVVEVATYVLKGEYSLNSYFKQVCIRLKREGFASWHMPDKLWFKIDNNWQTLWKCMSGINQAEYLYLHIRLRFKLKLDLVRRLAPPAYAPID